MIHRAAELLLGQLRKERHLRNLDAVHFSARAGYFLGEINVLHPFRDGNGRTQRAFFGQLAEERGFAIDWSGMSREAVVQASIAAYNGDPAPMAGLLAGGLSRIDN
jgi:cell filamentation protein